MIPTLQDRWQETKQLLAGELTKATYNAYIATAKLITDNPPTIITPNETNRDWLQNRLYKKIVRAMELANIPAAGLIITIAETNEPDTITVHTVDAPDPTRQFIITPIYAIRFWQPYIGCRPFALWQTLATFAWKDGNAWPSIQTLADIVAAGNRAALLGRKPTPTRTAQQGDLKKLAEYRMITIVTNGKNRKKNYVFRVLKDLPVLSPKEVLTLTSLLQRQHSNWLSHIGMTPEQWREAAERRFLL